MGWGVAGGGSIRRPRPTSTQTSRGGYMKGSTALRSALGRRRKAAAGAAAGLAVLALGLGAVPLTAGTAAADSGTAITQAGASATSVGLRDYGRDGIGDLVTFDSKGRDRKSVV